MNKKICFAFVIPVLLGLVGCGGGKSSNKDTSSTQPGTQKGNLDDGLYTNYVEPKDKVASVNDVRVDAYEAFTRDGTSIGKFKTIADAMNSAVDSDVKSNETLPEDQKAYGAFVKKVGGSKKLFTNKAGFDEGNNDQYYFYENGNSLAGYNCWDGAGHMMLLHNTNIITHQISGFGTISSQSWNGYTLLDSFGEKINDVTAQSWELSSTMDAGVICFPKRLGGITKLNYTIDLSEVKIAPPYKTCAPTYAFLGFYAWQDYYVIATGIACDTSTGNWYQFIGTSRDDSFSDVQYNLGECIFTSTYNDELNYFVPDAKTLKMSIETKIEHDDEWDEDYQVDYMKFELDNGAKFERNITDSLVNNFFPGYPLGFENSYAFIAGLDIKNKTVNSQYAQNTDYFNGSYFKGLKVTEAKAYVPTSEEMSDVKYGYSINNEWRGQWHDFLLANNDDTPEVMDYTILNTALCSEYDCVNNADVYNFSYTGSPVSANELGIEATKYQRKIDQLGVMAPEALLADASLYNEVGSWLVEGQTIIPQRIFYVLDFSGYYKAKDFLENYSLTDAARAVINQFKALTPNQYEEFGKIYEGDYAKLSEDEKRMVALSIGQAEFENREGLYKFAKTLPTDKENNKIYKDVVYINEVFNNETVSMTTKESFDDLLKFLLLVTNGTQWVDDYGSYNDDPNNDHVKIMNGDNNFWPSMRIVDHYLYFTETLKIELPGYIKTLMKMAEFDEFYEGFYLPIYGTAKIGLRIQARTLSSIEDLTEEELAFLNEYWTADYYISDLLIWNWVSGNKFETYYSSRTRGVTVCAGANGSTLTYKFFDAVADFLKKQGYTPKINGWGVEESVIK